MSCDPSSVRRTWEVFISRLDPENKQLRVNSSREGFLQRKLTLTVTVLLLFLIGGVAGQTAQASSKRNASSKMLNHPSPIVRGLLCIHSYEGSWDDPYSPYWGGLQMDLSFQRTYGWIRVAKHSPNVHKRYFNKMWGTADHWPIWAQLVAGLHGYFSRGWNPWPNTAHSCGLR